MARGLVSLKENSQKIRLMPGRAGRSNTKNPLPITPNDVIVLAKDPSDSICFSLMTLMYGWRKALLCGLGVSSILAAWGHGTFNQRLDRSWKRYRNSEYGYCVSIPSRWVKGEAFEGAGLYVKTGVERFSRPVGAIDFEAIESAPKDARVLPVSLADDLEDHLMGLQKFERAERMEILEKREMSVQGSAALFAKDRYYDPQERATWMEEVLFVNRNATVYRFELDCKPEQIERFAPVFEHLVGTVEFDCADDEKGESEKGFRRR